MPILRRHWLFRTTMNDSLRGQQTGWRKRRKRGKCHTLDAQLFRHSRGTQ